MRLNEPHNKQGAGLGSTRVGAFRTANGPADCGVQTRCLFEQLVNGGAKTDPLYKWLWNLPEVKEHRRLNPEDTFHYTSFVHMRL